MTRAEKEVQKALGTHLSIVWNECKKLYSRADKCNHQGNIIYGTQPLPSIAPHKISGFRAFAMRDLYVSKARRIFIDAVIEVYGEDCQISFNGPDDFTINGIRYTR